MKLYIVNFASYTGSGSATAFFRSRQRAEEVFVEATKVQKGISGDFSHKDNIMASFTYHDDFNNAATLNLINHVISSYDTEDTVLTQEAVNKANEDAQLKHGRAKAGFTT